MLACPYFPPPPSLPRPAPIRQSACGTWNPASSLAAWRATTGLSQQSPTHPTGNGSPASAPTGVGHRGCEPRAASPRSIGAAPGGPWEAP
eukprot:366163-Chlamydomonas_euryale.AAC.12